MHHLPVFCNGEATGHCCKHYWAFRRIIEAENPEDLQAGEKIRMCTRFGSAEPLIFGEGRLEMANFCNRYEKDETLPYDASFEPRRPFPIVYDEPITAVVEVPPTIQSDVPPPADTITIAEALGAEQ